MKEKNCWLFYLRSDKIPEKQLSILMGFMHGNLYAYALEKSVAKKFKKQRCSKYYYCRKVEKTERLVCLLTDKFQGGILSNRPLQTRIFDDVTAGVKVIMTDSEYNFIISTVVTYQFRPNTLFDPVIPLQWIPDIRIFKKKYREALQVLHYDYFRLCLSGDILMLDDDSVFKFDELRVFLNYFGIFMDENIK